MGKKLMSAAVAALAALSMIAVIMARGEEGGDPSGSAARREAALSVEYGLAKEPSFYFVLDLGAKSLELRVRGMVLRSWPIRETRFWGRPGFSGRATIVRKTALKPPRRIVIQPGQAQEAEPGLKTEDSKPGEFELEALELKDMPKTFTLDLDNGLVIEVRPKVDAESRWSKMRRAWRWAVGIPLKSFLGRGEARSRSILEITLDGQKDAQAVYWHFFESISGIII